MLTINLKELANLLSQLFFIFKAKFYTLTHNSLYRFITLLSHDYYLISITFETPRSRESEAGISCSPSFHIT